MGRGAAPPGDPPTGSATNVGPGFAGHTHSLALQTRPPSAQLVPGCQDRQAEPATTGRQRRILVPGRAAPGRVELGTGVRRRAGAGGGAARLHAGRPGIGAGRARGLVPASIGRGEVLHAGGQLSGHGADAGRARAATGRDAGAGRAASGRGTLLVCRAVGGDRAGRADASPGRTGDEPPRVAGRPRDAFARLRVSRAREGRRAARAVAPAALVGRAVQVRAARRPGGGDRAGREEGEEERKSEPAHRSRRLPEPTARATLRGPMDGSGCTVDVPERIPSSPLRRGYRPSVPRTFRADGA